MQGLVLKIILFYFFTGRESVKKHESMKQKLKQKYSTIQKIIAYFHWNYVYKEVS